MNNDEYDRWLNGWMDALLVTGGLVRDEWIDG